MHACFAPIRNKPARSLTFDGSPSILQEALTTTADAMHASLHLTALLSHPRLPSNPAGGAGHYRGRHARILLPCPLLLPVLSLLWLPGSDGAHRVGAHTPGKLIGVDGAMAAVGMMRACETGGDCS